MGTLSYDKAQLIKSLTSARTKAGKNFDKFKVELRKVARVQLQEEIAKAQARLREFDAHTLQDSIYVGRREHYHEDMEFNSTSYDYMISKLQLAKGDVIRMTDADANDLMKLLNV